MNCKALPVFAVMSSLLVAATAWGQSSDLTIENAWIRALPNHLPAAGYFTVENKSKEPAVLVGAESPACGRLMLHHTVAEGGTGRMEMVDRVEVPAGGSLSFAPGGYHLMCMMPSADVTPGHRVPIMLQFEGGASVSASFDVRNAIGN
ncbi:MAG TPA: copper chaperone PCu(A)C [Magnetospirillaceae bacterium]|jgi:hypothetical protein